MPGKGELRCDGEMRAPLCRGKESSVVTGERSAEFGIALPRRRGSARASFPCSRPRRFPAVCLSFFRTGCGCGGRQLTRWAAGTPAPARRPYTAPADCKHARSCTKISRTPRLAGPVGRSGKLKENCYHCTITLVMAFFAVLRSYGFGCSTFLGLREQDNSPSDDLLEFLVGLSARNHSHSHRNPLS